MIYNGFIENLFNFCDKIKEIATYNVLTGYFSNRISSETFAYANVCCGNYNPLKLIFQGKIFDVNLAN